MTLPTACPPATAIALEWSSRSGCAPAALSCSWDRATRWSEPSDDVILPFDCAQPDWELELAAVIGPLRAPRPRRACAGPCRRLHDLQRRHLSRRADPRPTRAVSASTGWRGRTRRRSCPPGRCSFPRPRRRPERPADHAEGERCHDAGRVDRRHGVRRGRADRVHLRRGRAAPRRPGADWLARGQRSQPRDLPQARAT